MFPRLLCCLTSIALGYKFPMSPQQQKHVFFLLCFLIKHAGDVYLEFCSHLCNLCSWAIHMSSLGRCLLSFSPTFEVLSYYLAALRPWCLCILRNHFLSFCWCLLLMYSAHFSQIFQTVMANSGHIVASFPKTETL